MNQVILSLIQPANNSEIQKSFSNPPADTNDKRFSDVFDNAVHERSNKVSQEETPGRDSMNKQNLNDTSDNSNRMAKVSEDTIKVNKESSSQDSNFEVKETVPARDFLKKLGLDESDIQNIMQANGLSETSTLMEFLESINFSIDNLDKFLESSAEDFLSKLGLEENRIAEIFQNLAFNINADSEKAVDESSRLKISLNDLLKEIDVNSEKQLLTKIEDLSVEKFFQELRLNENESETLIKYLQNGELIKGKVAFNEKEISANDLLKKMGLNTDEAANIVKKSLEHADEKSDLKKLILNKNFADLKQLATGKPDINAIGKSDSQGFSQAMNLNTLTDLFPGKIQADAAFAAKPLMDAAPVTSLQNSGPISGMNPANGTPGLSNLTNNASQIMTETKLADTTPRAFFEKTVVDQIVSKVSFKVNGTGQEEMKVHLDPPSLGSVKMKISVEGKVVNATIVTDNHLAKEIIQSNIQQLKDSMAEQGLKLENINVSVGDGKSRDDTMDQFRMFLENDGANEQAQQENENHNAQMMQMFGNLHRPGYVYSQSGVDLFV